MRARAPEEWLGWEGERGWGQSYKVGEGSTCPIVHVDVSRLSSTRRNPSLEHSETSVQLTLRNAWEE